MTRSSSVLNTIVGLAEGLSSKLPNAKAHLLSEMRQCDSLPGGSDAPKVQATAELTAVERAASRRMALQADLNALDAELDSVVATLRVMQQNCDKILGTRIEVPRCSAAGREGAIEWSVPDCWDAPTVSTLCAKCYHRERRWRQARGLPTRGAA